MRLAFLVATLLLSACGGAGPTTPGPEPTPPPAETLTVSGIVTGETATLITPTDTRGTPIGQAGAVAADASFSVTLQPPAYSETFNPASECRGGVSSNTLTLSTFTAQRTDAFFEPSGGTASLMRLLGEDRAGTLRLARYTYVSEPVTAQGQLQCADGFNPLESYQINLLKGWNIIVSDITFVPGGSDIQAITFTSVPLGSLPAEFRWVAEAL